MSEDWLKKIHDRMTDYEIEEPADLWEGIEAGLPAMPQASSTGRRSHISIWIRRGIAAAVTALVIIAGYYLVNLSPALHEPDSFTADIRSGSDSRQAISPDPQPSAYASRSMESSVQSTMVKSVMSPRTAASGIETGIAIADPMPSLVSPITQASSTDSISDENDDNHNTDNSAKKDSLRLVAPRQDFSQSTSEKRFIADNRSATSSNSHFSLSAYGSGIGSSVSNDYATRNLFASSMGSDKTYWQDFATMGIPVLNLDNEVKTDIKHRMPIRAGVSFSYRLTDRLAIESGISYANLTSDIREGSEHNYFTGEQKLHYIGIPVNLKYRLLSWHVVDLYASGGVLAEKCVSARLDKDYYADRMKKNSESVRLSDHPMQLSVNAAVGVQCRIIKPLALFVEPGISYYFDDGTDLQTIYKEKPLDFNLNLGLRLTFGE